MTATYVDASNIVKVLLVEEGHHEAREIWEADTKRFSSRLVDVEVAAAIAAGVRSGRLPPEAIDEARVATRLLLAKLRPVELTQAIAEGAADLAERHALKGADAIHLASGLALHDQALVFTTWDRRLHRAARAEGLQVAPASID